MLAEMRKCEWKKSTCHTYRSSWVLYLWPFVTKSSFCNDPTKKYDDCGNKKLHRFTENCDNGNRAQHNWCVHVHGCKLISFQLRPTLNNELFISVGFFSLLSVVRTYCTAQIRLGSVIFPPSLSGQIVCN